MKRRRIAVGILSVMVCLGLGACSKEQEKTVPDSLLVEANAVSTDTCEEKGHDMEVRWYGDPPDCTKGGYRAAVCKICGWVDEGACSSVEPLGHVPQAKELVHGNCREDTIIVYTCSVCGEETGYDRYQETEEHKWVWKETVVWDEETMAFVKSQVRCCERCNMQP